MNSRVRVLNGHFVGPHFQIPVFSQLSDGFPYLSCVFALVYGWVVFFGCVVFVPTQSVSLFAEV
jgi:hypothetical protein